MLQLYSTVNQFKCVALVGLIQGFMLYLNCIKGELMLQYKRRNSIEKSTLQQSNKPMVTSLNY